MSLIMKECELAEIPEGIYPLIDKNYQLEDKQFYTSVVDNKKYENELLEKSKSLEIYFELKKLIDEKIIVNLILKYEPEHIKYKFYTINPSTVNYNKILPELLNDLKTEDTYTTVVEMNKYLESIDEVLKTGEIRDKIDEMITKCMYRKEYIIKKNELEV